jgi:hypothetical protein
VSLLQQLHQEHIARQRRLGILSLPEAIKPAWQTPTLVELFAPRPIGGISCGIVCSAICLRWNCSDQELLSRCRLHRLTWPRHIAMFLTTKLTKLSLPHIGRLFCRDHTDVLYARRKIERMLVVNARLRDEIDYMTTAIGNGESVAPLQHCTFDRDFRARR